MIPVRYATLIVFANFLLDKATFLGHDTDTDDEDEETERGKKAGGASYPAFEEYLAARPEIKRILSRRTLD
jgi:hypothetical protein